MKARRCYEIDLLRIFGAFCIVAYHYTFKIIEIDATKATLFSVVGIFSKFGYLGVNLFFMISGFVILLSAMNKNPVLFAVSRVDRLYPTYLACVTVSAVAIYIFDSRFNLYHYLFNLTMINDYFNINDIDAVYWTLHAELKFYALVFFLMLTGLIDRPFFYLPLWLLFSFTYYFLKQPFFMGWFISPFYSSYFISGISLYLIYDSGIDFKKITILFGGMLLSVLNGWRQASSFIPSSTIIDKFVACLIIILIYLVFFSFSSRPFLVKKNKRIAMASALTYSTYLIHDSVGKCFFDYILSSFAVNIYILLIITISIVVILSIIIHVCVEAPCSGKIKNLYGYGVFLFSGKMKRQIIHD